MKRLFRSTKSSLAVAFLISLIFLADAFAIAPMAMVGEVKGNVFIHHLGKTKKLKAGDHIHNFSEIFTEMGSQVSFSDYYDHQYHLAGSGHVKINGKKLELKNGYLWLQSFNREEAFTVETANAHVNFMYGESVVSFDSYSGKSQIMTISGHWNFSNKFEKWRTVTLQDGQFSFVSKEYEDGTPRQPTPIGQGSYKSVVSLFGKVKTMDQQASRDFQLHARVPKNETFNKPTVPMVKTTGRKLASVVEGDQFPSRASDSTALIREIAAGGKTEEVVTPDYRPVAKWKPVAKTTKNEKESFMSYYQQRLNQLKPTKKVVKNRVDYKKKSGAKVYVFGADWSEEANKKADIRIYNKRRYEAAQMAEQQVAEAAVKKVVKQRAPASVPKVEAPKDVFESTLRREYKKQTRHTDEVNDLIRELQSYDQDYQRSY